MTDTENHEDDPITAAVKAAGKAPAAKEQEQPEEQVEPELEEEPEPAAAEADDAPFTKADGKPFTGKDHDALQAALKAARKEARDAKAEATKLTAATGGKDAAAVVAEAHQQAEEKWKPLLVTASARGLFAEAGLSLPEGRGEEVLTRAMRLLDVGALTVGEGGHIEGLKEQIEEIRTDFPELFRAAAPARPPVPRIQAADRQATVAPKTHAEQLAARLLNGAA